MCCRRQVWKCDITRDGRVTEADFVLFKLQQMQRVDPLVLDRLITRFKALDADGGRYLEAGREVPSAAQVRQLQAAKRAGDPRPLMDLWLEYRDKQRDKHAQRAAS